ncbi:hypothetical protein F5Y06DRAFT_267162 [Hypoxylon sp. FL0890]|nr:hypothetical protein F5Y06DRAFT_267162 [Hypoxylon sp. FL0890]
MQPPLYVLDALFVTAGICDAQVGQAFLVLLFLSHLPLCRRLVLDGLMDVGEKLLLELGSFNELLEMAFNTFNIIRKGILSNSIFNALNNL